jgi:hypothetical protein
LGSAPGQDVPPPLELLAVDLAAGEAFLKELQRPPLLGVLVATSPKSPPAIDPPPTNTATTAMTRITMDNPPPIIIASHLLPDMQVNRTRPRPCW